MRQDLFTRHRQRHKRQSSKCQHGNHSPAVSGAASPSISQNFQPPTVPSSTTHPCWPQMLAAELRFAPEASNHASQEIAVPILSSSSVGVNRAYAFHPTTSHSANANPLRKQRSDQAATQKAASIIPGHGQHMAPVSLSSSECGRGSGHKASMHERMQVSAYQSQDPSRTSLEVPTGLSGSLPTVLYDPQLSCPMSGNEYPDKSLATPSSSESAALAQDIRLADVLDSISSTTTSASGVLHPTLGPLDSSSCAPIASPLVGHQPPFAMEHDFTAWLFHELSASSY